MCGQSALFSIHVRPRAVKRAARAADLFCSSVVQCRRNERRADNEPRTRSGWKRIGRRYDRSARTMHCGAACGVCRELLPASRQGAGSAHGCADLSGLGGRDRRPQGGKSLRVLHDFAGGLPFHRLLHALHRVCAHGRGAQRTPLRQRLIEHAADCLRAAGFDRIWQVSDHVNLCEKDGFRVIDRAIAPWGSEETIDLRERQPRRSAAFFG